MYCVGCASPLLPSHLPSLSLPSPPTSRALPDKGWKQTTDRSPAHQGLTTCFSICRSYEELSDCTRHVAQKLDCFWPNAAVDRFFLSIHRHYFRDCPVSGRALQDPPSSVLCPFIVVPILVTLLVTALVVWRSRRLEGIV